MVSKIVEVTKATAVLGEVNKATAVLGEVNKATAVLRSVGLPLCLEDLGYRCA